MPLPSSFKLICTDYCSEGEHQTWHRSRHDILITWLSIFPLITSTTTFYVFIHKLKLLPNYINNLLFSLQVEIWTVELNKQYVFIFYLHVPNLIWLFSQTRSNISFKAFYYKYNLQKVSQYFVKCIPVYSFIIGQEHFSLLKFTSWVLQLQHYFRPIDS